MTAATSLVRSGGSLSRNMILLFLKRLIVKVCRGPLFHIPEGSSRKAVSLKRGAAQHHDGIRTKDLPPHLRRLPHPFTFKCRGRRNIPACEVGEDPQLEPFCCPPANIKTSALQQSDLGAHESFLNHGHDFVAADTKQVFRKGPKLEALNLVIELLPIQTGGKESLVGTRIRYLAAHFRC